MSYDALLTRFLCNFSGVPTSVAPAFPCETGGAMVGVSGASVALQSAAKRFEPATARMENGKIFAVPVSMAVVAAQPFTVGVYFYLYNYTYNGQPWATVFAVGDAGFSQGFRLLTNGGSDGSLLLNCPGASGSCDIGASSLNIAMNTWHYAEINIAAPGGTSRMFLNDVQVGETSNYGTIAKPDGFVIVGSTTQSSFNWGLDGCLSQLKITAGQRRTTSATFTPPARLSSGAYKIDGTVKEAGAAVGGRLVAAIDRYTGVRVDVDVSASDGHFSLGVPSDEAGRYCVIAFDDDAGTSYAPVIADRLTAL